MRWIPAHELYRSIGPEKGRASAFVHALTGCDVVSQPSLVKEINLYGRLGTCVMMLLMSMLDSASRPTPSGNCELSWSGHPGEVCGNDVRQVQHSYRCLQREAWYVCSEADTTPSHSTNSNSFTSACQAYCLPSRLYMEPINTAPDRNTEPWWLGMGKEWRSVECSLDNASTYCRELSTGDQVWMQVRMMCKCYCICLSCTTLCSCRCET